MPRTQYTSAKLSKGGRASRRLLDKDAERATIRNSPDAIIARRTAQNLKREAKRKSRALKKEATRAARRVERAIHAPNIATNARSVVTPREIAFQNAYAAPLGRRNPRYAYGRGPLGGVPPAVREAAGVTLVLATVLAVAAGVAGFIRGGGAGAGWGGGWGRRGADGARLVRDRSLGGRLVPVSSPSGTRRGGTGTYNPLEGVGMGGRTDGAAERETSRKNRVSAGNPHPVEMPSWWSPVRTVPVSAAVKERGEREARALVKGMENAVWGGGSVSGGGGGFGSGFGGRGPVDSSSSRDELEDALVELRRICNEGQCQTRTTASATGVSWFRKGCQMALEAAATVSTRPTGGVRPAEFVSGLARDLSLTDSDARRVSVAEVASKMRQELVDACTAARAQQDGDLLTKAVRIGALAGTFPFASDAVEVEMIGLGLQGVFTENERRRVLGAVGDVGEVGGNEAETLRRMLSV